ELARQIDDKVGALPSDAPPPEEAPSQDGAPDAAVADAPQAPTVATDSPENARASLQGLRDGRLQAAAVIRAAAPIHRPPYRLVRQAIWEEILDTPANNAGQLEFGAVDLAFVQQLEDQLNKGEYAPVIEQSEARLLSDPLWLDLNFLTVRAME